MFLVSSECDVLSSHQSLYFCKKLFQITLASFLLCCVLDVVFVCLHVVCLLFVTVEVTRGNPSDT